MADENSGSLVNTIIGTTADDTITTNADEANTEVDSVNGHEGSDTITTGDGSDLAAGDMVGAEWQFVNGKWVYNADAIVTYGDGVSRDFDDVITTGVGDDVLLGNGGNDTLFAGAGGDRINAGTDNDQAFGGLGNDTVNLEGGNDYAEGGLGADTVNAGAGNDVVYGDDKDQNVLSGSDAGTTSIAQMAETGDWISGDSDGRASVSQSVETNPDETYTISFELAANLATGKSTGTIEVLWDGQVVGTVTATSGVYETHEIEVPGAQGTGELTFREALDPNAEQGPTINTDGPIFSYEKTVQIGDQEIDIAAFAPGQPKLYQVIDGQLNVFDTETESYQIAGDETGLSVNAIGFNVEDDLIYGIAKSPGVDALGNAVSTRDLVMMDAEGNAYRIGETPVADFVGDFDDNGNLWTFQSSMNRVTLIDVDNLDSNGDPVTINYTLPNDFFEKNIYDVAYNSETGEFFAVESPGTNGGTGYVHRIDISDVANGGEPTISSIPITGTLYDHGMSSGMAKGAYGAVFLDGDGNLYYGLNNGDHDLSGNTDATGGIFKVVIDWPNETAYSEYMAEATATGKNDGAVDPRSADAFADTDIQANPLIRNPKMESDLGGNDKLRGGQGDDEMYGGAGADTLSGAIGDDLLSGDAGNDSMLGGDGEDIMFGGDGSDTVRGGDDNDIVNGGAGADKISGNGGSDSLIGGSGDDVAFGGAGDDTIQGNEGTDSLIGGNGDDLLFGGDGTDTLRGGAGNDNADGGAGADTIAGNNGNDALIGGSGDDAIYGGAGNDTVQGNDGNDFLAGGSGNDEIFGGAGSDKLIGGTGSDTLSGGSGDDHLWGGKWTADGTEDTFVISAGGGKDMIHDFETAHDLIDLSSYGVEFSDISAAMSDKGWATEIDLSQLTGGQTNDKLIIKSVDPEDLDESNFIL